MEVVLLKVRTVVNLAVAGASVPVSAVQLIASGAYNIADGRANEIFDVAVLSSQMTTDETTLQPDVNIQSARLSVGGLEVPLSPESSTPLAAGTSFTGGGSFQFNDLSILGLTTAPIAIQVFVKVRNTSGTLAHVVTISNLALAITRTQYSEPFYG